MAPEFNIRLIYYIVYLYSFFISCVFVKLSNFWPIFTYNMAMASCQYVDCACFVHFEIFKKKGCREIKDIFCFFAFLAYLLTKFIGNMAIENYWHVEHTNLFILKDLKIWRLYSKNEIIQIGPQEAWVGGRAGGGHESQAYYLLK